MSFAHGRADDQARSGNREHQQANFCERFRWERVKLQGDNNTEIKNQEACGGTLNSVTHGDPNQGNESQVKELVISERPAEHDPEHQNDAGELRDCLEKISEFLWS